MSRSVLFIMFFCWCVVRLTAQSIIKVGVIDDGFLLSHKSMMDFIYTNDAENPFNQIDDDKNGYINDIKGWDVSDSDNDVEPNQDIIEAYFHGTFISSAICQIAKTYLGDEAYQSIQIIPIKATSDTGDPNRLLDGYAGIEYATAIGANIIITAWNGGSITAEQSEIIKEAQLSGVLIIASAGNEARDRPTPPASIEGVMAVSAIDLAGQKMFFSNYGSHIDVSALGEGVTVASTSCDSCYMEGKNTSLAVALVGGLAAVIKAKNPDMSNADVINIIKNSSDPYPEVPHEHIGKLGAGAVNMDRAIQLANTRYYQHYHNPLLTEGTLYYNRNSASTRSSWSIRPKGPIHKTQFRIDYLEPYNQDVNLYIRQNGQLVEHWTKKDLLDDMTVSGTDIELLIASSDPTSDIRLSYESLVLDSTNYYCQEEIYISDEVGMISDGSGDDHYVNGVDCQWKLTGPVGTSVFLEFKEMDTEGNVDFVYIFEGHKPLQTNLLAKFSGDNLPPKIHSHSNEVLIWFLSDGQRNGQGWSMEYLAIEAEH